MKLDELIADEKIMYRAYKKSCRNRSYKKAAKKFSANVLTNLEKLQKELLSRKYKVSGYTEFKVYEPKERMILACLFRDKIVQHVLCDNILCPMLKDICIEDNYAGQVRKGTGYAQKRMIYHLKRYCKGNGTNGYVFRGDVKKYYYSIDHEIAKNIMHKHYPQDTHWLIDLFIDSTDNPGIALGNQINTVVSNLYLHELDLFITKDLGYEYYGRYADDFWLIDRDKERLKENAKKIERFINDLKLELNLKSQIMPLKNGIKFIGFHFYLKNGQVEIKLDNKKKRNYRRKFNKMAKKVERGELPRENLIKSYNSWKSHAKIVTNQREFAHYERRLRNDD